MNLFESSDCILLWNAHRVTIFKKKFVFPLKTSSDWMSIGLYSWGFWSLRPEKCTKNIRRIIFSRVIVLAWVPSSFPSPSNCYCWAFVGTAMFSPQCEKCENGADQSWVHLNTDCAWAWSLTFHENQLYAFVKYGLKCFWKLFVWK